MISAISLFAALSTVAQAGTPPATAPVATAAPVSAPAPAASPGQASPQISISGWSLQCSSPGGGKLFCQLLDQVSVRSNGAVLAAISVHQPTGSKTPTMLLQVPVGIAVDEGVHVSVAAGTEQTLPVVTCNRNGCFAQAPIGAALLAAMRAGKAPLRVVYSVLDSNGGKQAITITLSLDGFSTVYDRLP
jgi:invasion protein IalB